MLKRLLKSRFAQLRDAAAEARARRLELDQQLELSSLATQIDIPDALGAAYSRFCDSFQRVAGSALIWDTVSHRAIDQFAERSQAARAIERKPVRFGMGRCPAIQSTWLVPHLENANGGDLYLYPLFVVYFAGEQSFALLEYGDLQVGVGVTRFHEEERIPPDSRTVGKTWAKTNKDGSPDRRFRDNYEIPVVEYGKLVLKSATGLDEEYMFSNADSRDEFARAFEALLNGIARGG